MCGSLAVDITERTGMIFPSLCSYAAVIENLEVVFFFFSLSSCLSVISLPIRMSFTSSCRPSGSRGTSPVTQTVTSWNLPSRIKVSWPYLLLPSSLPPSQTSELLYLDTAHFIVRRSHLVPPKTCPSRWS